MVFFELVFPRAVILTGRAVCGILVLIGTGGLSGRSALLAVGGTLRTCGDLLTVAGGALRLTLYHGTGSRLGNDLTAEVISADGVVNDGAAVVLRKLVNFDLIVDLSDGFSRRAVCVCDSSVSVAVLVRNDDQ